MKTTHQRSFSEALQGRDINSHFALEVSDTDLRLFRAGRSATHG
jgi:hypothetical protein